MEKGRFRELSVGVRQHGFPPNLTLELVVESSIK